MKAIDWLLKGSVLILNALATISVVFEHFAPMGWIAYPLAGVAVILVDAAYLKVWLQFEDELQNEAEALTNLIQLAIMTGITWVFGGIQGGFIGLLLRVSTVLGMVSSSAPLWLGKVQQNIQARRLEKSQRKAYLASPEGLAELVQGELVRDSVDYVIATLKPYAQVVLTERVKNALPLWLSPFGESRPLIAELPHGEVKKLGEGEWIASCQWCEFVRMYASEAGARSGLAGHQKAHSEIVQ
jgi:hypothetical protein